MKTFGSEDDASWRVHVNTGTGFSSIFEVWELPIGGDPGLGCSHGFYLDAFDYAISSIPGSQNWSVLDLNGDALVDLVVSSEHDLDGEVQEFNIDGAGFWKAYMNQGNGFSTQAMNWSLPAGGSVLTDHDQGFHLPNYSVLVNAATGAQSWATTDMNGDGWIDLVVTSELNTNGFNQEFSPQSNSYWKVFLMDHTNVQSSEHDPSQLERFPCPASSALTVVLSGEAITGVFRVTTVDGRIVHEMKATGGQRLTLDVSNLLDGCYLLSWVHHKGRRTARFTVVH